MKSINGTHNNLTWLFCAYIFLPIMINMEFNKGFFDKLFKQTVAIPLLHQNYV